LLPHRTLEEVANLALRYFGHFAAEQPKQPNNSFVPPQPVNQQFGYGYGHSYTTHPVRFWYTGKTASKLIQTASQALKDIKPDPMQIQMHLQFIRNSQQMINPYTMAMYGGTPTSPSSNLGWPTELVRP